MDADPPNPPVAVAPSSQSTRGASRCEKPGTLWQRQPRECLEPLDTDRPHRTDTPSTVPPGYTQTELGLATYEAPTAGDGGTLHFADMLFKLGLSKRVDLQLGYSPVTMRQRGDRAGWLGAADSIVGRSLYVRSKLRLLGLQGSPMALTIAPVLSVPLSRGVGLEGGATLLFGADLTDWLSWELNGSLFYEAQERSNRRVLHFVPCSALTTRLFGPLKAFAELYFERPLAGAGAAWTGTVDGGLLWLLTNDLQLDLGIYVGTNAEVPAYTAFIGFSFRL